MRFDELRCDALKLDADVDIVDLDYTKMDDHEITHCSIIWYLDVNISGAGIVNISPTVASLSLSLLKKTFNEEGPDSEELEDITISDNIDTKVDFGSREYTPGSADLVLSKISIALNGKTEVFFTVS